MAPGSIPAASTNLHSPLVSRGLRSFCRAPAGSVPVDYHFAMESNVATAYDAEISLALKALQDREHPQCFYHLERAHILGQRSTIRHTYAHWLMFRAGLEQGDFREVLGQLPRMLASLAFSRIWVPLGNTGRSRVPAMKPMPIPEDLRHLGL